MRLVKVQYGTGPIEISKIGITRIVLDLQPLLRKLMIKDDHAKTKEEKGKTI